MPLLLPGAAQYGRPIDEWEVSFEDYRYRAPYKFGGKEVDRVTLRAIHSRWTSTARKACSPLLRSGFRVTPETKDKKPMMEPLQIKGGDLNGAHARNFLDCVKSRQTPSADVEEGRRSAVMCHLGNISTRLGRSIKWDATKEQAVGDAEANDLLVRPYRAPWEMRS